MTTKEETYEYGNAHPLDYKKDGPVNFISKNKEIGQSDFRLHFVLPNIKLGKRERVEELLNEIRVRVSKVGTPQTVQVLERRKNFLDIAVGMRFDFQAISYLHNQNKKVLLMDSESSYFQVVPLVCKTFYMYLEHIGKPSKYRICTKENLHFERKLGEQKYRDKMQRSLRKMTSRERSNRSASSRRSNSSDNFHRDDRSRHSSQHRYQSQQYRPIHLQQNLRMAPQSRIIAAGVPQGMEYKQIDDELYDRGYSVDKMLWLKKNNIQLLQIKLAATGSYEKFLGHDIKLRGQSIVVILVNQYEKDGEIVEKLMQHQARIEFRTVVDKSTAIEQVSRYGNVVDCLEDRENQKIFYFTFSRRQAVSTILKARDPNFEPYLDKDIFPIRRKIEAMSKPRRELHPREIVRSNSRVEGMERQRDRDWGRERERERDREPENYNYSSERPTQRYYRE